MHQTGNTCMAPTGGQRAAIHIKHTQNQKSCNKPKTQQKWFTTKQKYFREMHDGNNWWAFEKEAGLLILTLQLNLQSHFLKPWLFKATLGVVSLKMLNCCYLLHYLQAPTKFQLSFRNFLLSLCICDLCILHSLTSPPPRLFCLYYHKETDICFTWCIFLMNLYILLSTVHCIYCKEDFKDKNTGFLKTIIDFFLFFSHKRNAPFISMQC